MTGHPVNIADFRCRVMKPRTAHFDLRDASRSSGLRIVDPVSTESAPVFDIEVAREVQRTRRRSVPRPISIQRRGTVIRFSEMRPRAFAAPGTSHAWTAPSHSPYDLPPAA